MSSYLTGIYNAKSPMKPVGMAEPAGSRPELFVSLQNPPRRPKGSVVEVSREQLYHFITPDRIDAGKGSITRSLLRHWRGGFVT